MMLCLYFASVTAIVGGVSFYFSSHTDRVYRKVIESDLAGVKVLSDMRAAAREVRMQIRSLAVDGLAKEHSTPMIEAAQKAIIKFSEREKIYNSLPFDEGEEKVYKEKLVPSWNKFLEVANRAFQYGPDQSKEARSIMREIFLKDDPESSAAYSKAIAELIDINEKSAAASTTIAMKQGSTGNTIILALSAVSFVLAIFIGILFSNRLTASFSEFSTQLSLSAQELYSASGQISEAGAQLSQSANSQAAALQETVSSVDEISAMINKNADNTKTSQDCAARSQETASHGKVVVENMIRSIDEIDRSNGDIMQQVESSNNEISDIVKVISEIGTKTKVINDIVFQTKLLSFNASVEAARAGEHGKGFAVVAEEVGNLAQMSGNAAKEISQLLDGSISKVEKIVSDTKTKAERLIILGKEKIAVGIKTARQCGEVLDQIVANVASVNQMTSEIATASSEQSQGVHEITKAMAQLDQISQQNATASQQSSHASEKLIEQSQNLNEMVKNLGHLISGSGPLDEVPNDYSNIILINKNNIPSLKYSNQESSIKSKKTYNE